MPTLEGQVLPIRAFLHRYVQVAICDAFDCVFADVEHGHLQHLHVPFK